MSVPVLIGADFRARYAIQRFQDGGILVDLATGTYLRLNLSATDICSVLFDTDEIARARSQVAQRLGASDGDAECAIQDVMEGLRALVPTREPLGAFRYLPAEQGGYVLTSQGTPRVRIDADGRSVRLASPGEATPAARIFEYLRAVAPKLLFLQSAVVIHGAASRTSTGVRIISGESGAGKTTTARAFEAAGADLFAEDMLIVASLSPLRVYAAGEQAINDWAARSSERLAETPEAEIDASTLRTTDHGEPTAVSEIWFIDGSRRARDQRGIRPRKLGETEGALALMQSLFLGSGSPEEWRQFLSLIGTAVLSAPLFEAMMPAGLDRLRAAARAYTENSAS